MIWRKRSEILKIFWRDKDSSLKSAEGSLAEAHLRSEKQNIQISEQSKKIEELNRELEKTKSTLQDNANRFNREIKGQNRSWKEF